MSHTTPATIRPQGRVAACAADPQARQHLELAIRRNGYDAIAVGTMTELRQVLLEGEFAAAVIDEPTDVDEIQRLDSELRRSEKATQFILIPKLGHRVSPPETLSCSVVEPPLTPERIGRSLFGAIGRAQLIMENIQLRQKLEGRMFDGLVGVSQRTRDLRTKIHEAAEHDSPVLVQGPQGSGKSEVARAIHLTRSGPGQPSLTLRCSLLTAAVIEKELFGDDTTEGRLTTAADGTLVFEDIEALTLPQQAQLADIIVNNAYKLNGEYVPLKARIIATTSADLAQLCQQDKVDARLVKAIAQTVVHVAPLSQRMEDVPVLAEHFLQQCSVREGQQIRKLSDASLSRLTSYNWPGNVRELENVITRCCSLTSQDVITPEEIEPWLENQNDEVTEVPGMTLREMERKLIEATFNRFGGNRELTAKALKIGIRTLSGKLREYGYPPRGGPGSNRKETRAA